MLPMTTIQAKIHAAKYASGPFSYYNSKEKKNKTAVYYRGDNPLFIQKDAMEVFDEIYQSTPAPQIKIEPQLNELIAQLNDAQIALIKALVKELLKDTNNATVQNELQNSTTL